MYHIYNRYSEEQLSGAGPDSTVYCDHKSRVVVAGENSILVTQIHKAPSWQLRVESEYPYFLSPTKFLWFSDLKKWRGCDLTTLDSSQLSCQMPSSIELFACLLESDHFSYLGKGVLTSCGVRPTGRLLLIYALSPILPREEWMKLGGYSSWYLTIGLFEFEVRSSSEAIEAIRRHWGVSSFELRITRYEGDVLEAITNDQNLAQVSYQEGHDSPQRFSGRYIVSEEPIHFMVGEDWEVWPSTIITRDASIQIICAFMSTGIPVGIEGYEGYSGLTLRVPK